MADPPQELWAHMKANVPQITLAEIPKKGTNFHASLPLAMQQRQVRNISWDPVCIRQLAPSAFY